MVKYDSFGTARWAASGVTSGAEDIFTALTLDSAGALYAVGAIAETGTVDFGDHVTAAGTHLDGYGWSPLLVKYR